MKIRDFTHFLKLNLQSSVYSTLQSLSIDIIPSFEYLLSSFSILIIEFAIFLDIELNSVFEFETIKWIADSNLKISKLVFLTITPLTIPAFSTVNNSQIFSF